MRFASIHVSLEVVGNWFSSANWILIDTAASACLTMSASFKLKLTNPYLRSISEKLMVFFRELDLKWEMQRKREVQVSLEPGLYWKLTLTLTLTQRLTVNNIHNRIKDSSRNKLVPRTRCHKAFRGNYQIWRQGVTKTKTMDVWMESGIERTENVSRDEIKDGWRLSLTNWIQTRELIQQKTWLTSSQRTRPPQSNHSCPVWGLSCQHPRVTWPHGHILTTSHEKCLIVLSGARLINQAEQSCSFGCLTKFILHWF